MRMLILLLVANLLLIADLTKNNGGHVKQAVGTASYYAGLIVR
jgi:hypothetical protein